MKINWKSISNHNVGSTQMHTHIFARSLARSLVHFHFCERVNIDDTMRIWGKKKYNFHTDGVCVCVPIWAQKAKQQQEENIWTHTEFTIRIGSCFLNRELLLSLLAHWIAVYAVAPPIVPLWWRLAISRSSCYTIYKFFFTSIQLEHTRLQTPKHIYARAIEIFIAKQLWKHEKKYNNKWNTQLNAQKLMPKKNKNFHMRFFIAQHTNICQLYYACVIIDKLKMWNFPLSMWEMEILWIRMDRKI